MAIRDRKEREKQALRKLILNTAYKIFMEKGYEETSIRNIAGKIEYSPAMIYLYFHDKNEILFHLQEKVFENFNEKINEFSFMKDSFSRLKKLAHAYVEFAASNPSQYELLFYNNPYEKTTSQVIPPREKVLSLLREHIESTISRNQFSRMPINEAVSMVWSFLHGISSLSMKYQMSYVPEDEYSFHLDALINRFFNSFKGSY
jgi:AcrR family transcriptional regulator